MAFPHDTTGVEISGARGAAPAGVYVLQVTEPLEAKTRNGDNMIKMKVVIADGTQKGKWCFANAVFKDHDQPGAGIGKNWLKALNQKFEGKVDVDASKWANVKFKGRLIVVKNEKNGVVYDNNELTLEIWNLSDSNAPDVGLDLVTPEVTPSAGPVVEEEISQVPF